VARPNLEAIFDVSLAVRAELTPEERAMVSEMVDAFEPVTWRINGVRNEGAAIDPRAQNPVQAITAPTLVVHAQDDGINPFSYGEYTAEHIRGAEFLPLPTGGHLLLGHHADVRARVNGFLRQRTASAALQP
jgi:2-hydroxy-6-oxonona-2,4-dienedioate hydrolase